MTDPLLWHRLQFAFTIIYHYLFPQLTMGLALLIVDPEGDGAADWAATLRTTPRASGSGSSASTSRWAWSPACRWSSSSAPTGPRSRGTPAASSARRSAMEGMFAFFLESSFLGLLVFGEKRLGPARPLPSPPRAVRRQLALRLLHHRHQRVHAAPGRPRRRGRRTLELADFWAFLLNPWALAQYAHTMMAAVVTGVVRRWPRSARTTRSQRRCSRPGAALPRSGVIVGLCRRACWSRSRPATARPSWSRAPAGGAGRDGRPLRERAERRASRSSASPTWPSSRLDNPIVVPGMLSFLAYGTFHSDVAGLDDVPARTSGPTTSSCSTTRST